MTRIASPGQLSALGRPAPLSEKDFMRQVRDAARRFGWDLIFHAPSVMAMSERGWPDLVMVRIRDRRLIFAELKRDNGKTTVRQDEVLEILRSVANRNLRPDPAFSAAWVEVHLWRPTDWPAIEAALR